MIRLAEYLLRWTKDSKYADYIERNLYNGIMAQAYWKGSSSHGFQSNYPDTGLLTYFLPMKSGSRKGWSSETNDFFCCHGTLVQANAAFNRMIYYKEEEELYICQLFDSEVNFDMQGKQVRIIQKRDTLSGSYHSSSTSSGLQAINFNTSRYAHNPDCMVKQFKIMVSAPLKFKLKIRRPSWAGKGMEISINGESITSYTMESGFITIDREWMDQDELWLYLPMEIQTVALPDDDNMIAFTYGPMVLAGICSEERTLSVEHNPKDILIHDNEREWSMWKPTFRTRGQEKGINFVPIAEIGYEQYEVYFPIKIK